MIVISSVTNLAVSKMTTKKPCTYLYNNYTNRCNLIDYL